MWLVRGVKLLLFIATIVASVLSCVVSASLSSQTEQLAFLECISYSCHHRILGQMLSGKNLMIRVTYLKAALEWEHKLFTFISLAQFCTTVDCLTNWLSVCKPDKVICVECNVQQDNN